MYNHAEAVFSVAIRGNLIVSGSDDGFLYRFNVTTGEVIGSAFEGHGGRVTSVAISADGKLIVSISWHKTVRRCDAERGEAIGFPLQGHTDWLKSVAISSDGELIVSFLLMRRYGVGEQALEKPLVSLFAVIISGIVAWL